MSLDKKALKARDAALSGALQQIERQFGKGSVMRMGDPGAQVKVNAAISDFSGIVKCDVLQATTVIATTYTPGAGNVW